VKSGYYETLESLRKVQAFKALINHAVEIDFGLQQREAMLNIIYYGQARDCKSIK
jgi:hypothetical protein